MITTPATFTFGPQDSPVVLPVSRISTETYLRMIDAGDLEGERVELIEGYITPMAPGGPEHSYSFLGFSRLFAPALTKFHVAIQVTLNLSPGNVVDPDLMLLKKRTSLKTSLPRPEDVVLLIESADSSLRKDRRVKLPLYAAAGIPEYWILDLKAEQLHVHRDPEGEEYRDVKIFTGEETISPVALSELSIRVTEFFE